MEEKMLTGDMKYICDAEIGKLGAFKACRKPAIIKRQSENGVILHYCDKHRSHAENPKPSYYRPMPGSEPEEIMDNQAGPDLVCNETAYGSTQRLSFSIKCF